MSLKHSSVHQVNGEYICTHCGKSWDTNDIDPPECEAIRASGFVHKGRSLGKTARLQAVAEQFVKNMNAGPLTRKEIADSLRSLELDANVAWMVTLGSTSTVIYASSRAEANEYVQRLIGAHPGVEVYRLKAMDEFAIGSAPYFELNPDKLKRAAKAQRCEVISFHRFKEYVK